jgi:hypothetical protein
VEVVVLNIKEQTKNVNVEEKRKLENQEKKNEQKDAEQKDAENIIKNKFI